MSTTHDTQAATDQGLDPITAALRAAGFDVKVENTGGHCMVAYVYATTEARVGITTEDGPDGPWLVCGYEADEDTEGNVIADTDQADHVIDYVRGFVRAIESDDAIGDVLTLIKAVGVCRVCGEQALYLGADPIHVTTGGYNCP